MSTPEAVSKIMEAKASSSKLLGEIVTWSIGISGAKIDHAKVVTQLVACGFDQKHAKEFKPSKAFTRACNRMKKEKVINILSENESTITFQFNTISRSDSTVNYPYQAKLTLHKFDGHITSEDSALAERATEMFLKERDTRGAIDITHMIQKIMQDNADLFSIRDQGGCYFVPQIWSGFVDQVEKFITSIGGTINRFPIPDFTARGTKAVHDTVKNGINDMVQEHMEAIASFDEDTRPSTLKRRAEAIKKTEFKLDCYASFLEDTKADIAKRLKAAKKILANKLQDIAAKAASK